MTKVTKAFRFSALLAVFLLTISINYGYALNVGSTITTLKIKDANDNPAFIPFIGKKVVTIFYADPDVSDVNDPLADALKAKKYDKTKYKGIGIANCDVTWKPNAAIRYIMRKKIKKYKSIILADVDKTVAKKWNLGKTNGYSIVIIVGKDRKVKYIKKISSKSQSKSIIATVTSIVENEIKK